VISSAARYGNGASDAPVSSLAQRDGTILISTLIDLYMASYAGRDTSRPQRLAWWQAKLGTVRLSDLTDDDVFRALEELATCHGRYWAGTDADENPIYKAKKKQMAPATINRYAAALEAVLSWSIKGRIAPRGWHNPCRAVERRRENNERVRFRRMWTR
jgi:hypothetical protein